MKRIRTQIGNPRHAARAGAGGAESLIHTAYCAGQQARHTFHAGAIPGHNGTVWCMLDEYCHWCGEDCRAPGMPNLGPDSPHALGTPSINTLLNRGINAGDEEIILGHAARLERSTMGWWNLERYLANALRGLTGRPDYFGKELYAVTCLDFQQRTDWFDGDHWDYQTTQVVKDALLGSDNPDKFFTQTILLNLSVQAWLSVEILKICKDTTPAAAAGWLAYQKNGGVPKIRARGQGWSLEGVKNYKSVGLAYLALDLDGKYTAEQWAATWEGDLGDMLTAVKDAMTNN